MAISKKELDETIVRYLQDGVAAAQAALDSYMERPSCCRMASDYLIRQTVGHAFPWDLDLAEAPRQVWSCKKCGRVVLDES